MKMIQKEPIWCIPLTLYINHDTQLLLIILNILIFIGIGDSGPSCTYQIKTKFLWNSPPVAIVTDVYSDWHTEPLQPKDDLF